MALKTKFKTREEIPTELQPHYVEQAGEWVLDHDGKAKIEEFRAANIALKYGYAGTTTPRIAEVAGLTRGAMAGDDCSALPDRACARASVDAHMRP